MAKYSILLKNALKNKVLHYVFSRYATYIIQFANSLFIAIYLGPYYLGVWGFIQLIIQYINQINFGVPHAVNNLVSTADYENKKYSQQIIGNGIGMLLGLSLLVGLLFSVVFLLDIDIGVKYNFYKYITPVFFIGVLGYFNGLFSNVFRIYGKVIAIAINQSIFPVIMLVAILLFKGENLLWALIITNLMSVLISFLIYLYFSPVSLKPSIDWGVIKIIQRKGWFLFLFNTSLQLIILSTRSIISGFYSVEEFGLFTFAYSLSHAILLFFQALSFLIFPKLLNRFATLNNSQTYSILETVRNAYITSAHFLVHLVVFVYPLFLYFFPKYDSTFSVFTLTVLTVVLYTNSFGFSDLLQARGKERILGWIALLALVCNIIFGYILVSSLKVTYEYVIMATLSVYFLYMIIVGIYGFKSLSLKLTKNRFLNDLIQWKIMIPLILSVILVISESKHLFFVLPILFFIILNFGSVGKIKNIVKQVIRNPNIINIK